MPERTPFAIGRDGILIATGRKKRDTRKMGYCLHRMNYTKLSRCQGRPDHAECETVRILALASNPIAKYRKRKISKLRKLKTSDHRPIPTSHSDVRKDGFTPDRRTTLDFDSNAESVRVSRYAAAVRLTAEELGLGLKNPDSYREKS